MRVRSYPITLDKLILELVFPSQLSHRAVTNICDVKYSCDVGAATHAVRCRYSTHGFRTSLRSRPKLVRFLSGRKASRPSAVGLRPSSAHAAFGFVFCRS